MNIIQYDAGYCQIKFSCSLLYIKNGYYSIFSYNLYDNDFFIISNISNEYNYGVDFKYFDIMEKLSSISPTIWKVLSTSIKNTTIQMKLNSSNAIFLSPTYLKSTKLSFSTFLFNSIKTSIISKSIINTSINKVEESLNSSNLPKMSSMIYSTFLAQIKTSIISSKSSLISSNNMNSILTTSIISSKLSKILTSLISIFKSNSILITSVIK